MAAVVFWLALAIVAYVYAGYPVLIGTLARLRPRRVRQAPIEPTVSFVIAAYNEEGAIRDKIENTLALDYPADKLEVIVFSDGSTDRTEEIVLGYAPRVRLCTYTGRIGKTMCQNRTVEQATGEILVFSDATTVYDPKALRALVRNFADPAVGLATGMTIHGVEIGATVDKGRNLYWSYESILRTNETRFASILGASGCVYALRRALYTPLPGDVISDVCQTVRVVGQGYRAVAEDDAIVYEPAESKAMGEELRRRARVVTRGLRGKWYLRDFFARHPWFLVQVLSHRVLRWLVPVFLIAAFVANLFLLDQGLYRLLFAGQVLFYGLAVVGYLLEGRVRIPGLMIPLYFCLMNIAPLVGIWDLLRGERKAVWETGRETPSTSYPRS